MVTTFYPPQNFGGDGRYVRRLAHALARRGIEVEVVYDADAWRTLASHPEEEPAGVTVHRLGTRWPLAATLVTQQTGLPLVQGGALRRILARDFDVIHYHNVSLIGGPGVLALGDAIKLYTAHEHWLVCPTHVLWRHGRELCTARQCTRCQLSYGRPPQAWRATDLLERMARHIDVFLALSESVADNHRAFGFARAMQLTTSFLPDDEAQPVAGSAPAHMLPSRPYFLFVGRLLAIKGLQDVIPLFRKDLGADLVIAGSGSYEGELRALAAGSPRIHFLGHVAPDALAALYRNAVALIAPSVCYEVFPMVVLEAFREGTPVIARRLGPYPQIVEQSGAGVLFDDAESLEAQLRMLAGDRAQRDALGASGRGAVATCYSEATAVDAWLRVVRDAATARGRTAVARRAAALLREAVAEPDTAMVE